MKTRTGVSDIIIQSDGNEEIHQGTGYRYTKIGKQGCGLPAGRYNFLKKVVKKLMKLKIDKKQ